jgi:hypothetical protein
VGAFSILIPVHPYFNTLVINLSNISNTPSSFSSFNIKEYYNSDNDRQNHQNYFYRNKIREFIFKDKEDNEDRAVEILRNIFSYPPPLLPLCSIPERSLLIHIRSGDIFNKNPHPMYIPPPLSYYLKIIETGNYECV